MDITHHLYKTELENRTLFYDGDSVTSPDNLIRYIELGLDTENMYPDVITDEIQEFNRIASKDNQITKKEKIRDLRFDWKTPTNIDVVEYVADCWSNHLEKNNYNEKEIDDREIRINNELKIFKTKNLFPLLQAIIYVINTLQQNNIVWGVGRGSSVSSYVLYLIGVHDVDSVKYELDFTDFIRQ